MIRDRLRNLQHRVRRGVDEALEASKALVPARSAEPLARSEDEPPVVARLMVEIRSDGSRTVARGAVEDIATGERVGIEAKGSTPAQLAGSLARNLFSVPLLARQMVRSAMEASRSGEQPGPRNSSTMYDGGLSSGPAVPASGQAADEDSGTGER